jgi:hypothetical protein
MNTNRTCICIKASLMSCQSIRQTSGLRNSVGRQTYFSLRISDRYVVQAAAGHLLNEYATYIATERRRKDPDYFILCGLYERALAEVSKRQFTGKVGAERAL